MKNKILITLILGIFLIGIVSAGTFANFFYSEKCSHCQKVFPFVKDLSNKFEIRFYDVNMGSYNVQGVPMVEIKTNDKRIVSLIGSEEIPKYLKCELQEMTTKECPTLSVFNSERQSWFIE